MEKHPNPIEPQKSFEAVCGNCKEWRKRDIHPKQTGKVVDGECMPNWMRPTQSNEQWGCFHLNPNAKPYTAVKECEADNLLYMQMVRRQQEEGLNGYMQKLKELWGRLTRFIRG